MINLYLDIEMNRFWRQLRLSLLQKFNIDVDDYISKKKKKSVHMCLEKPLLIIMMK